MVATQNCIQTVAQCNLIFIIGCVFLYYGFDIKESVVGTCGYLFSCTARCKVDNHKLSHIEFSCTEEKMRSLYTKLHHSSY